MSFRHLAYRAVRWLLRQLIDPRLRAEADLIFAISDARVAKAIQQGSPELVSHALKCAAGMALAPNKVEPWHVDQLRDLYDPKTAAKQILNTLAEGLEP